MHSPEPFPSSRALPAFLRYGSRHSCPLIFANLPKLSNYCLIILAFERLGYAVQFFIIANCLISLSILWHTITHSTKGKIMPIKELKEQLKTATLETAQAWEADSEKTLFLYSWAEERGFWISAWDNNMERLRDIFEDHMYKLLGK